MIVSYSNKTLKWTGYLGRFSTILFYKGGKICDFISYVPDNNFLLEVHDNAYLQIRHLLIIFLLIGQGISNEYIPHMLSWRNKKYIYLISLLILSYDITDIFTLSMLVCFGGSVACVSDWRPGGRGFDRGWQLSFVETDHEIFSTVILSLLLIQEGQLSVSG